MILLELLSEYLLKSLFYLKSELVFSEDEIAEYERLFKKTDNTGLIKYNSTFPKYRFIEYISLNKNVVLHGSNKHNIKTFEPRKQTLYNGKYVEAVFATKDGSWPVFFAVLDKEKVKGDIRNACLSIKRGKKKFIYFSLTQNTIDGNPWTAGMLYFFPQDSFHKASNGLISFDEWISENKVEPIARLAVSPSDFYYINRVTKYNDNESIISTWIKYKWRLKEYYKI